MNQYCRYCTFCFQVDDGLFHCGNHPRGEQPTMTRNRINRKNNCKNFLLSDQGDAETGEMYNPRHPYKKRQHGEKIDQLSMWEET